MGRVRHISRLDRGRDPAKIKEALLPQTLWVKEAPEMRAQTMKTQWGSCTPHSRLTMNSQLVKAPRECIDYVLLHELCHIAEHNHSQRLYRRLARVLPNWETSKPNWMGWRN